MIERPDILEKIFSSHDFQAFSVPMEHCMDYSAIIDTTFFLRKDGLLVNAEGWFHPAEHLVGEVLYAPDENGDKQIFGIPYRKVTLYKGTYTPVPYPQRGAIIASIDPALNQTGRNPFFARYKQILPLSDFAASFPAKDALRTALHRKALIATGEVESDLRELKTMLDAKDCESTYGLTGCLALGQISSYHDFDIVFFGSLNDNLQTAKKMRHIALSQKKRRCFDGGKAWQIRFLNDEQKIFCCFFCYADPRLAPLRNFHMSVLEPEVMVEGYVCDDTHSMYTPTLLKLEKAKLVYSHTGQSLKQFYGEGALNLIIYHTATRGECFNGDHITAKGALVEVCTDQDCWLAVCSIDREAVRNLTPPWENYYG